MPWTSVGEFSAVGRFIDNRQYFSTIFLLIHDLQRSRLTANYRVVETMPIDWPVSCDCGIAPSRRCLRHTRAPMQRNFNEERLLSLSRDSQQRDTVECSNYTARLSIVIFRAAV